MKTLEHEVSYFAEINSNINLSKFQGTQVSSQNINTEII
jgi:hypothetical protein